MDAPIYERPGLVGGKHVSSPWADGSAYEDEEKYAVDAYDFDLGKFTVLNTPVAVVFRAGEYLVTAT